LTPRLIPEQNIGVSLIEYATDLACGGCADEKKHHYLHMPNTIAVRRKNLAWRGAKFRAGVGRIQRILSSGNIWKRHAEIR
jgi:hypothetical protein